MYLTPLLSGHRHIKLDFQGHFCCQKLLYKNQINARTLIGQSAVVYCASELMEKSRVF